MDEPTTSKYAEEENKMAANRNQPILYIGLDGLRHNYKEKLIRDLVRTTPGIGDRHLPVSA